MDDYKEKLEQGQNTGVVAPTVEELAEASGGISIDQFPILSPDSNWDQYITDFGNKVFEPQNGVYFDTLGCNIFSSTHCLNAYINARGGDPFLSLNNLAYMSSRYACVGAGLTGFQGSSEKMWEDFINNLGMVREDIWPFPYDQRQPIFDRPNFFAPVEKQVLAQGKQFYTRWQPWSRNIGVSDSALREALKYGPVKLFIATGFGWNNPEPQIIPRTENEMNHAVMLRKIGDDGSKYILDQYSPYLKRLAPNYMIFFAFQTLLTKKGSQRMLVFFQDKSDANKTQWALMDGEWVGFSDLAAFNKYIDGRPFKTVLLDHEEFLKLQANPDVFKQ